MTKRPAVIVEADVEAGARPANRTSAVPVDTNLRPHATSVPELSVIAKIYLDSLRNGRRPIDALMERFHVDRDSAKIWPAMCRAAGLLPARHQPHHVRGQDLPAIARRAQARGLDHRATKIVVTLATDLTAT
jgi:hypothetical protein